jgi:hypothetical protein
MPASSANARKYSSVVRAGLTSTSIGGRTVGKGKKPGPKADRLVVDANWKDAAKRAMAKGKPPAEEAKPKKKRRSKRAPDDLIIEP